MTVWDMHCDMCGRLVPAPSGAAGGPLAGVRFVYHPGSPSMRDDSGLACRSCWTEAAPAARMDPGHCAVCAAPVTRVSSLHVRPFDSPDATWQLCEPHAVEFLNRLRTVQPKFDPVGFRLPLHTEDAPSQDSQNGPGENEG